MGVRRRIAPWANMFGRSVSRSRRITRTASLLINQCNAIIGHHFSATSDPNRNGERWLVDVVGSKVETFIDIGANVGDWTMMMLARNPLALGIAVEPGTVALERLRERLPATVDIVPAAAGSVDGSVIRFFEEPEAGVRSSAAKAWSANAKEREVEIVTIDALMDQRGWERIDFLKVDTEGYDARVLLGATKTLNDQRIDIVQFEYNLPWREVGSTLGAAISFLNAAGYDVHALRPFGLESFEYPAFGEFFSYANFVAVSRTSRFRSLLQPVSP